MVVVKVHWKLDSVGGQMLRQVDPASDARERLLATPVLNSVCQPAFVEGVAVDHQVERSFRIGCELDGVSS